MLAVTFLIVPLTLNKLGESNYGLWMVAFGLLNYLVLSDLGLCTTMARGLARSRGRGEPAEESRAWIAFALRWVSLFTVIILTVAAIVYFAFGSQLPPKWEPLREPFALLVLGYLVVFPLSVFGHALVGLGDLGFYWLAKTLQQLATAVVTVVLLVADYGLMGMVWGFLAGHWLIVVLFTVRLFWKFPEYFPRRLLPSGGPSVSKELGDGFWANMSALGNAVLTNIDVLILGWLLDPVAVAVYALTIRLPNTIATQLSLVVWTLMPSLAEVGAGSPPADVARVLRTVLLCQAILVGAAVVLVAGVNETFIRVWVPDHPLFGGHELNAAFLGCMFLRQLQAMTAQMLFSLGFNHFGPLTTLSDGILTTGLMIAFVGTFGLLGVPLAGIVGALAVSLPINLIALGRTLGVSPTSLFAPLGEWFVRFLPVLGVSAGVVYASRYANGWWEHFGALVIGSAVLSAAYFAVMLPLLRRTPLAVKLPWRMQ